MTSRDTVNWASTMRPESPGSGGHAKYRNREAEPRPKLELAGGRGPRGQHHHEKLVTPSAVERLSGGLELHEGARDADGGSPHASPRSLSVACREKSARFATRCSSENRLTSSVAAISLAALHLDAGAGGSPIS